MNMQQIREKAHTHGIKAGKLKKLELIKTIQTVEGNTACYGTALDMACDQSACLWRNDCLQAPKKRSAA